MKLERFYPRCRFSAETLEQAIGQLGALADHGYASRQVTLGRDSWNYDNDAQFLASYRQRPASAVLNLSGKTTSLFVMIHEYSTSVAVSGPTEAAIQTVMAVFERGLESAKLPEPPPAPRARPTVFIGHGRSPLWRDLKDQLQEKHSLKVVAFEVGERAGHAIRDILMDMLDRSSIAFLVLTAEDEMGDGSLRPRENVVHETGLFQGRLGFNRAIALVESGVEPFSNLQGIIQIRFSAGNIRESFGDVVAAIEREFPEGRAS